MQHLSPEQVSEVLNLISEQPEPWTYLDQLRSDGDTLYYTAKNLLGCLDPSVVAEVFGPTMLWCVAASSVTAEVRSRMVRESVDSYGTDEAFFHNARDWAWQKHGRNDIRYLSGLYNLYQSIEGGEPLESIDLEAILQKCATTDQPLSAKRIERYSLMPLRVWGGKNTSGFARGWNTEVWPSERFGIYLDAPVGFTLNYKDRPQAVAALSLNNLDELIVTQIQGVQAQRIGEDKKEIGTISARGLAPLSWQPALIEVAEDIAFKSGIPNVSVQSAKNNTWVNDLPGCEDAHVTIDQIYKNYDQPALAMGYELGADGNYHKCLQV